MVTDDATRRVTFHLTTPDPDFLEELTRFVYPTPAGTPTTHLKTPLPGTGPYMITGYKAGEKQFTLSRNPYFRQWSYAAQPAGYPDVIRWQEVPNTGAGISDVVAGRIDVLPIENDDPASDAHAIGELARQYPAQLYPSGLFETSFEVLNTAVAPFNDVRVRRAVNYAVDRQHLVEILGGPSLASATCQFLPPNFPGYQPYCPYTTNPSADGGYHGADLAAARPLVAESGTSGTPVTVVGGDFPAAYDEYFVTLLRQLGYRATLRNIPDLGQYVDEVFDSRKQVQIASLGWTPDFPSPANSFACCPAAASCPRMPQRTRTRAHTAGRRWTSSLAKHVQPRAPTPRLPDSYGRRSTGGVTDDAAVVATVNSKIDNFVSTRLGNFQTNPQLGPLFDQMWVR